MEENNKKEVLEQEEEAEEVAERGRIAIKIGFTTTTLALVILLGTFAYTSYVDKKYSEEYSQDLIASSDDEVTNEEDVTTSTEETYNVTPTRIDREIDYSNVDSFYNEILAHRNKYGKFAEHFQTKSDVIDFVNFFYLFDERYEVESSITSQAQFFEIVQDYFKSCLEHDIKPSLSTLFDSRSLTGKKFAEYEPLLFDLKNGKGSDYTIPNNLYMWLEDNMVYRETAIMEVTENAPLIYSIRIGYDVYRNVGNMIAARSNQKNDYYKIEQRDVPYGYTYGDDVEVINHSFCCPDAVDNVVSITENVEETKWIQSYDGSLPFDKTNEAFDYILNNRRAR